MFAEEEKVEVVDGGDDVNIVQSNQLRRSDRNKRLRSEIDYSDEDL